MKRKHQIEMEYFTDGIADGSLPKKDIVIEATPGAGKSSLPIIAGRLIQQGIADGIAWAVPRQALQRQGESAFLDPFFRDMFNHSLTIRSSTNDLNPCRDQQGFITTYQALEESSRALLTFRSKKMILFLDEPHHLADGGAWHKSLQPLVDNAYLTVLMSGTLKRADRNRIAFLDYHRPHEGGELFPDFSNVHKINYTRADGLIEKAILPIKFHVLDGNVSWSYQNKDDQPVLVEGKLSSFKRGRNLTRSLYSALNTDFSKDIIHETISHWKTWNLGRPQKSKLLVVTADQDQAIAATSYIRKEYGLMAQVATSRESKSARKNIYDFTHSKSLNILSTVAMAYEGLDVPAISHIASITNIRSVPWIEQMIARAVRIWKQWGSYDSQLAHVFCPDDFSMRLAIEEIQEEQNEAVKERLRSAPGEDEKEDEKEDDEGGGFRARGYSAVAGQVKNKTEIDLNPDCTVSLSLEEPGPLLTVSEQEGRLRGKINKHVQSYAYENRYDPMKINGEIKRAFLVPRSEMSMATLKSVLLYVREKYPVGSARKKIPNHQQPNVSSVRGSGRRLPKKKVWTGQISLFG